MRPLRLRDLDPGLTFLALLVAGCGAKATPQVPPNEAAPLTVADEEPPSDEETEAASPAPTSGRLWSPQTFSPHPGSAPEPELDDLTAVCGTGDAALHDVAGFVAERQGRTGEPPSLDEINFELRRAGAPYVAPRMWAASTANVAMDELTGHVKKWSQGRQPRGQVRCGAGLFESEGEQHWAVLAVDVGAELAPLPTQVEAGTWLDLHVGLLVPSTAVSVVLLPPDGPPRTVSSTIENSQARARLSLPTAGTWLIQVMATQEGGPIPVVAALVTAGGKPPDAYDAKPVPGEKSFDSKLAPADALFALVNAARKDEGLPLLTRSPALDRAARSHSERMREQGRISHDTGDGDPAHRVAAVGLAPKATGENVALAQSVPRLHRVLWASPSHRENLLLRRWDEIGIGIVKREDGSLMATQLFIDSN